MSTETAPNEASTNSTHKSEPAPQQPQPPTAAPITAATTAAATTTAATTSAPAADTNTNKPKWQPKPKQPKQQQQQQQAQGAKGGGKGGQQQQQPAASAAAAAVPPSVFHTLGELFVAAAARPPVSKSQAHAMSDKDLHEDAVFPVCQHNLYKLSPYFIDPAFTAPDTPVAERRYRFSFPESKLGIVNQIRAAVPDQLSEPTHLPPEIRYKPHTPEDGIDSGIMWTLTFHESTKFTIEDLITQLYVTYANSFNFETWYHKIANVQVPCKPSCDPPTVRATDQTWFIPLLESEVETLFTLHQRSKGGVYLNDVVADVMALAAVLKSRATDFLNSLPPSKPFFFKLNSRSAKDSRFYKEKQLFSAIKLKRAPTDAEEPGTTPEAPLIRCQARTFFDVVSAMVSSDRISGDCNAYLRWKVGSPLPADKAPSSAAEGAPQPAESKPPALLVLQHWNPAPAKNELRCWVYKGQVTGINPSAYPNLYPALLDRALQVRIISAVKRLHAATNHLLPWDSYILDVAYDEEKDVATVSEYNPWGPYCPTGSQLYSWELDMDILYGVNLRRERQKWAESGSEPSTEPLPDFRVLHRGMQVKDMFDLHIGKLWYSPAPELLEQLDTVTHQCPCCPRVWSPEPPPTRLVHLCRPIGSTEKLPVTETDEDEDEDEDEGPVYKMVILVRTDAKMQPGKVASQTGHAVLNAFLLTEKAHPEWCTEWRDQGEPIVVLKIDNRKMEEQAVVSARAAGIAAFAVQDAGRTQVKSGTHTCVGIGPAPASMLEPITGSFSLY
ncbi:unconventional myosin-VI [Pelomyxa schiedti]|nr:unconventional myosin-VI [Pelomyxa schiedti]